MSGSLAVPVVERRELALHGGTPVRARWLPYSRQALEPADAQAVAAVLASDWLTTGPEVEAFEQAVAAAVGAAHAVAFSSGTAALHGAAHAAGLGPGDEAITTPLTFAATANCVLYQQATPVFADVRPDTLTLDPAAVRRRLTARTRVLLPVDYGGHPAELDALTALAREAGLLVIEDACQALGARWRGRPVGGLADMTVFSFHPVKHIATGEGGMVTTNSAAWAQSLRRFRNHGIEQRPEDAAREGAWYSEMTTLGYNYRLPDLGCALGRRQLARLPDNLARRRAIAAQYAEAFRDLSPWLELPQVAEGAEPAWHLYPVRLRRLAATRRELFDALRAENIGVQVHHIPVYTHPYYRARFGDQHGQCPVAEEAYARLLSLPMFHGMTDQDAQDVIAAVHKVVGCYAQR